MSFGDLDNATQIAINEEARNLCFRVSQECFLGQSGETGPANFAHYHPYQFRAIVKEILADATPLVHEKMRSKYAEHIQALSGSTPFAEGGDEREIAWLLRETATACAIRRIIRHEEFHPHKAGSHSSHNEASLRMEFDCNPGKRDALADKLREEIVGRAVARVEQLQAESQARDSTNGIWAEKTSKELPKTGINFP